jgi:hypothetical protein
MKNRLKQVSASLLAAIMVFTYMPVFGLGAVYAIGYDYTPVNVTIPDQVWTGDYPNLNEVDALASISTEEGAVLERGVDFEVESNAAAAGEALAEFTGIGKYEGKTIAPVEFTIKEDTGADTYEATIDPDSKYLQYNGEPLDDFRVARAVTLTKNGKERIKYGFDELHPYDIKVEAKDNAIGDAGDKYAVTVSVPDTSEGAAEGDVVFSQEFEVAITKLDIGREDVETIIAVADENTYKAEALTPAVSAVTANGLSLNAEKDYDVTYTNNVNAGTGFAVVTAKATSKNFTGTAKQAFEIAAVDDDGVDVVVQPKHVAYTGALNQPQLDLVVYFKDTDKVVPTADYEIVYDDDSIAADTYPVELYSSGNGNLSDFFYKKVNSAYTITAASLKNVTITQTKDVPYGTDLSVAQNFIKYFDVTLNGVAIPTADFSVDYNHDTKKLTLSGSENGNFNNNDTKEFTYTTTAGELADKYFPIDPEEIIYDDGRPLKPNATKLGDLVPINADGTLDYEHRLLEEDYEVLDDYANNINATHGLDLASASIRGKNNYSGTPSVVEFAINKKNIDGYEFAVSGLQSGKYYKGQILAGLTVKAVKLDAGTGEALDTISLASTDYVATVNNITNDGKLDSVLITEPAETGNYSWNAEAPECVVAISGVAAGAVDFDTATLTDNTIPAGLVPESYANKNELNANLQKYIEVVADGAVVNSDAYELEVDDKDVADLNRGKPNTTLKVKLTPTVESGITGETREFTLNVEKRDIADLEKFLSVEPVNGTYNGEAQTVSVIAHIMAWPADTAALTEADYTLTYSDNVNAGTATATLNGAGNYKNSISKSFKIEKASLKAAVMYGYLKLADVAPSKTEYAVGAPADLSDDLEIVPADNTVKYEISKDDYGIAIKSKPVYDHYYSRFSRKVVRDYSVEDPIYINYFATVSKTSKNYIAGDRVSVAYKLTQKNVKTSKVSFKNGNKVVFKNYDDISDDEAVRSELGAITVTVDDIELTEGVDFKVEFKGSGKLAKDYVEGDVVPYADVTFMGNYAGSDTSYKLEVVEDTADLSQVKLIQPTAGQLTYTVGKTIKVVDNLRPMQIGKWTAKVTKDGKELVEGEDFKATPKGIRIFDAEVGDYTITIVARDGYASVAEGDSISFTVTPQKLNAKKFDQMVKALRVDDTTLVNTGVMYFGKMTLAPVLTEDDAEQFEVLDYSTSWDGDPETLGTATIALKNDANYSYDGTAEVKFQWVKGDVTELYAWDDNNYDPKTTLKFSDFFEILDQEYTGSAIEPGVSAVKVIEGSDMSADWVYAVDDYDNNTNLSKKSAVAWIYVEVPKDDPRYVAGKTTGQVHFGIVTPEDITKAEEAAKEAATEVLNSDAYSDTAKAAVETALKKLDTAVSNAEKIEFTDALNKAVAAAKKELTDAAEAAVKAAGKITSNDYKADAVSKVNKAKADLEKALASGDASAIKAATTKLNDAIKAAANQKKDGNKLTVSKKKKVKKVKAKSLKKKAKTVKVINIKNAQGTVTCTGAGVNKKSKKALKVLEDGRVKIKKKAKKGTYKAKINVTAAGDGNTYPSTKSVTVTIKVK